MPTILGANTLSSGYDVDNSLRFNSGDSARLTRTQTSGDRNKATLSAWVKRSKLGANQGIFGIHGASSDAGQIEIRFQSSGEGFHISGHASNWRRTSRAFRDISAWYHLVVAFDTTLSTAGDRVKVYVNGVQETAFAASENPDEDEDLPFGLNNATCSVGSNFNAGSAGEFFGGYLAEVVLIDGQQLDPTSFGEFDEDSPTIWKPKDVSGLTFGNNGFYLQFKQSGTSQNSSGLGADTSGNDNHFATSGLASTDQSTDTCTNNFATVNLLDNAASQISSLVEGNLKVTVNNSNSQGAGVTGTLPLTGGKWYYEVKLTDRASDSGHGFGITDRVAASNSLLQRIGRGTNDFTLSESDGTIGTNNTFNTAYGNQIDEGDVVGVYIDLDNNKIYFSEDGTLQNSTGASITAVSSTAGGFYLPVVGSNMGGGSPVYEFNFGGAQSFSISSAVSDDNGYGNFEYSPNITGDGSAKKFYAICTKNIAEFG